MRIAVFTDIHGNREALEACLADAQARGVDRKVFLGDYVGYGADPEWAVDTVAQEVARGAVAVRGNHDDAMSAPAAMNRLAMAAIAWTRPRLGVERHAFLAALPLVIEEDDRLYVHASANRPACWPYVMDRHDARECLAATAQRVTLCGHVHVPALYALDTAARVAERAPTPERPVRIGEELRWLAVIGAVGQPRDGRPAAHYALLDTRRDELTFRRVAYDAASAARKIRAAGLPEALASRLEQGL